MAEKTAEMMVALSISELISSLCRGGWDERRSEAFALLLLDGQVPIRQLAQTARWLLTQVDPDDITPAKLIAAAKQYTPPAYQQLTSDQMADEIRRGYGQPTSTKEHPGQGITTGLSVELPDRAHRRRLQAQYLRMATETAVVLGRRRAEERAARRGKKGTLEDALRPMLDSILRRWLERSRSCDFCRVRLTEENLKPYLEWCRDLGQHRPIGTPMPADKVFCGDCAPGAISELIDGIRYDAVPF